MPTPKTKRTSKKPSSTTAAAVTASSALWHYEHQPETYQPEAGDPADNRAQSVPISPTVNHQTPDRLSKSSIWLKLQALAIFLFPFLVWPGSSSPLEFSKQTYLAILVGFTLLAVLIDSWKKQSFSILVRHPFLFTGFTVLVLAAVSASRSGLAALGVWGYGGTESLSLISLGLLGLWTLLIFHTARRSKRLIVNALIASGSILSLVTLLALLGLNLYRFMPTSGFNPAGTTTAALLVGLGALILALGLWLNRQSKKSAIIYALAIVPPLILLLGSGFRAPLIAAASGLLVLLIIQARAGVKSPARLTVLLLGLIIAVVLAIWPLTAFLPTPLEIGPSHPETLSIAKQALAVHPILGSGPASFSANYLQFRSLPILQTPFWNVSFDWGSSAILTALTNLGLLGGGLLVISLLAVLIWHGAKFFLDKSGARPADYSGALLASGAALLTAFALSPMLFAPQFFLATILGLMLSISARPFSIAPPKAAASIIMPAVGAIAILLIVGLFIGQGRRVFAEALAVQGVRLAQENPAEAQLKIARALRLDRRNDSYLRMLTELQRSILNQKLNAASASPDQQNLVSEIRAIADGALQTAEAGTELAPRNVLNWATLGNVYLEISPITSGASAAAAAAFAKALELSPADPSLLVNLGIARALEARAAPDSEKQKNEEEATKSLLRAAEIRPNFPFAHLELARLYASLNKTDEAITAYRNAETLVPQDAALRYEVGLFLLQKDRQDEARAQLEAAIAISANFSNARWFLAQILEEEEDLSGALEQIRKVLELNPENEQAKDRLVKLQEKIK
ncbi:hypothetical protein HYW17_02170 [Candidatus Uhrbacteria bacterium]|nr:hypothetical protein [Candidatus Uhrbacteria bacterium]